MREPAPHEHQRANRRIENCLAGIARRKITADDFQLFLSGLVTLLVTDSVFTMLRTGMTREQVNAHLADVLMPSMVKLQRDALGIFNAALHGDPAAPSLTLQ